MNGFLSSKRIEKGPWQAFERGVARFFEHQGWPHVVIIDGSNDRGGDIIVSNDKQEFIIQVKFKYDSAKAINKNAVQELKNAIDFYSIEQGFVVTNSRLSSSANEYIYELNQTGYNVQKIEGLDLLNFYQSLDSLPAREYMPHAYQIRVLDSLWRTYKLGTKRTMLSLATGLGKTFVAGTFLKRIIHDNKGARILVLADQRAIVKQFERALWKHLPKEISTHIWDGSEEPSYDEGITLATFQKLINVVNKGEELGHFDVVIIDEAHHAPSFTYSELIENLEFDFLLGMTATPWRTDKKDLTDIFGPPCERCVIDIIEALKNGYLSQVDYNLLCDNLDWDFVNGISKKNYTIKDLNKKLFIPERDDRVLEEIDKVWKKSKIKRAILYCASIEHAKRMEYFLRERGYSARCLHSNLDIREAENRLRKFRQGDLQILTSMNMLNEGVDIPEVDLIVFLRVTHSRIIFLQQLGRGLRLSKDKQKVIVLDFVADLKRVAATIDLNSEVCKDNDTEILNDNFGINFSSEEAKSFFEEYLEDRAKIIQDSSDDEMILFPSEN